MATRRKKTGPKKKHKRRPTAKTSDRHALYQLAVQEPSADIAFIQRRFRKRNGRKALVLREDFCGTALMCAEWVRGKPTRTAHGLDLDQTTLDWGREQNLTPLGADAERVRLYRRDVLDDIGTKADATCAFNFSYCVFKERRQLLDYCRAARDGLSDDGGFFLDICGGLELGAEVTERTKKGRGITYIWDQEPYDPINGFGVRHIHFEFSDGSRVKKAFTYDWRLWSLPELRDVLRDAGFSEVEVYWEGDDGSGEGNGIFTRRRTAEEETAWIAYVVAWRSPADTTG